jgi:hypothetical protein
MREMPVSINNTMKTMMAVAAFALAIGSSQAQTFREAFESAMETQAKRDYDFEQQLRRQYGLPNGKGMVLVSSHHASVSADFNCFWPRLNHQGEAQLIAAEGLAANPDSAYFEATIRDSQGEGRSFLQRSQIGDFPLFIQATRAKNSVGDSGSSCTDGRRAA